MLKDAGISAIYVTEFKRTQQTAAPLAKALGITVTTLPAKDNAALVAKLRASNGNALVVGHSDTIPDLIKALGISEPINIAENDYDNLFAVVLDEKPHLIRLHYRECCECRFSRSRGTGTELASGQTFSHRPRQSH